jgi:thioester reductase-like protein
MSHAREQHHSASTFASIATDERIRRATVLPDHLEPAAVPAPQGAALLVTGASGFLGSYLLRALLARTTAPIICLARGNAVSAREHLTTRLAALGVKVPKGRLSVISGSITQERLGLPAATYLRLANEVGIVFHLAAQLDFRSSFDRLRAVNVDNLPHILSLAATSVAKRIVYVSSLSVLEASSYYGRTVTETTPLVDPALLPLGYAQTKWAAETMLGAARARGFAVLCVRPSWIVGHDPRGIETNFIACLVRILAAVGATPNLPGRLNLVPVSFVGEACALLGLMQGPSAQNGACHLGAPQAMSNAHFADAIAATGRTMDRVPMSEFLRRVSAEMQQRRSLELMMFRHIFVGSSTQPAIGLPYLDGRAPVFDATATLQFLQDVGLPPPTLDLPALVRSCLRLPAEP